MWNITRVLIFVIVCTASAIAISDDLKELLQSMHNTCVPATGISEDVLARAQKGNFDNDEKLKCYMRCILNELGGLTSDGKIDIEKCISVLSDDVRDRMDPIIRKCGVAVGANECETAFLLGKCVFDEDPSLYFLP